MVPKHSFTYSIVHSLIVVLWLMLSVSLCPKIITLSDSFSNTVFIQFMICIDACFTILSNRSGVLNLLILPYPQIRFKPFCVPPKSLFNTPAYPQIKLVTLDYTRYLFYTDKSKKRAYFNMI
jgi:hypothetical protein